MSAYLSDSAETSYVQGPTTRFAYRRFGTGRGVPLVLALRFRGTVDHWDPAFLEVLASARDVIVFDNAGCGLSSGRTPDTVAAMADGAVEFIEALGLPRVDLLGWSMGGAVVQAVALRRPELVRRLVVAASGPGGVPGTPPAPDRVWEVAGKPVNDDEDFLYLFFPDAPAARAAGLASLRRLDTRLGASASASAVRPESVGAQAAALGRWGRGEDAAWERLGEIAHPVLAAAGAHDVMVHAFATYAMSQRLADSKVVIYGDAGHGFLFQHPEEFGGEVLRFLAG
ncbi:MULTISPECIES: alpha/beta fold hydrolase [unclassified Streptomyces]|uniref:alpha/beta fold hydrolase n=1 Tax=unclassified Streptomyces TaxID=2593676 RepID=UPI002E2D35D7|nr:alpha/beta hydrolase [Streptomyces sp. NBC_00273]